MSCENRFKRFTAELLELIEKYMKEWAEAEKDDSDTEDILTQTESEPDEPVMYKRSIKKSAVTMNSGFEESVTRLKL